jgi:hypothetical protein
VGTAPLGMTPLGMTPLGDATSQRIRSGADWNTP